MVPLAGAEESLLQAAQKDPEARRAKNRRAEAYFQYVAASRLSVTKHSVTKHMGLFSSLLEVLSES